ncbi:Alkylation response protein AidB-like acyl-CoA dehydrogenase OS=Ureibacillus acetophenoni OX=614649 GN=SAMN05877842_105193 PE=4 SV=1 [Ureibacillus acetophenoni]
MFTEAEKKKIKSLSEQMDREDLLELIYEQKLFKVFTPMALDGLSLSLVDGLKVFQRVGAVDGNVGWAVTIGSGGNMFIPLFDQRVCEERFSYKEAVIAGSGKFGTAERVNGGYIISGTWKYCSGSDYATLFTMNCRLANSEEIVTCSVSRETVEIIPDWNAMGLRATSSHSMKLSNVFVKDEETFKFDHFQNQYELPVHSFPFITFSEASFFSLCLGLTEQFLSEAAEILERKKDHLGLERYQYVMEQCSQHKSKLENIEERFFSLVSTYWQKHNQGKKLDETDLATFTAFCKEHSTEILMSSHSLIRYFGMDGIMENSPLNRAWRNLCTASQHMFLTP